MQRLRVSSYFWMIVHVVFIIFLYTDCSISFLSSQIAPTVSSHTLLYKIHHKAGLLKSFQGTAKLRMLSADYMFKGNLKIRMKSPDSLWMKFEGPMGIDVASVRVGGQEMQYYIPSEKIIYNGTANRLRELNLLPWNVEVSNIIQSFLGLIDPPYALPDSTIAYSYEEGAYILPISPQERIWIDPRGPVVSKWERRDSLGNPLWVWEGEMFYKRGKLRLPKFIQITQYNPRQRLTFFYEIMDVNHKLPEDWYAMKIPEGVEEIEL